MTVSSIINAKVGFMKLFLVFMVFCYSCIAWATGTQIKLIALFESKAMLSINGKNKTLKEGDSFSGVTLISVDTKQAIVEVNDNQQVLELGVAILSNSLAAAPRRENKKSATLWADDSGFFFANGVIDGKSMRFLVDTGANIVALSSAAADSLGLEYKNAPRSYASTASGNAIMHEITIKKMNVEGLELYNIKAGVIIGSFPEVPLLGMSFLGELDMQRTGEKMELKKRF